MQVWAPEVVQCRSWNNHPWVPHDVFVSATRFAEVLRCSNNCGKYKNRILDRRTGRELRPWQMSDPPEYAMPRGKGRITKTTRPILHKEAMRLAVEMNRNLTEVPDAELEAMVVKVMP